MKTRASSIIRQGVGVPALIAALALASCGHAHSVEDPALAAEQSQGKAAKPGRTANDTPPSDRPRAQAAAAPKPRAASEIPLSTSPAGQLEAGAVKKIQDRLVAQDFLQPDQQSGELDERTTEGLRRFQKSRDLASTGTPDRETVRKLGLDPREIFRAAR